MVTKTKKVIRIESEYSESSEDSEGSGSREESDRTFSLQNPDELKDDEGLGIDDASEEDESENVFRVYDARFKLPAGTTGGSSKDPPTF